MANLLQIPGLFLQHPGDSIRTLPGEISPSAPTSFDAADSQSSLPPVLSPNGDFGVQHAAGQHVSANDALKASSDDQVQFNNHEIATHAAAMEAAEVSADSREEGEVTDTSADVSLASRSSFNGRKRKAGSPVDDHRPSKFATANEQRIVEARVRQHLALHVVSTLISSGFSVDQLVQDIYGITQARRQQGNLNSALSEYPASSIPRLDSGQPSVQVATSRHATEPSSGVSIASKVPLSNRKRDSDHGSRLREQTYTSASLASTVFQPKPSIAKPTPRDQDSYRAQLGAFKKVGPKSTVEPPAIVMPKPIIEPAATVKPGVKIDREVLRKRIAALKAENANKSSPPPGSSGGAELADPAISDTSTPDMISSSLLSSNPGVALDGRLTAIELIEAQETTQNSPMPGRSSFTSPMGVDEENPMIIEASSSEDSADESDSSSRLGQLISNIELLHSRIAARELNRKKLFNSPAVLEESDASTGKSTEPLTTEAPGSLVEVEEQNPTETVPDAPMTLHDKDVNAEPESKPDNSPGNSLEASSTASPLEKIDALVREADSAGLVPTSAVPLTAAKEVEGDEQTTLNLSVEARDSIDEDSKYGDGFDDDDDAPMSIDSGESPTPEMWAESNNIAIRRNSREEIMIGKESKASEGSEFEEESAPMDISRASSEGYEPQATDTPDAEPGATANLPSQSGSVGHESWVAGDDSGSDDEYDPEMVVQAGMERPLRDVDNAVRRSMSRSSTSRSPTPGGGWRMYPHISITSGVTIRNESGTQPDMEKAPLTDQVKTKDCLAPYEPKLRFSSDELLDPLNFTS